MGTEEKLRFTIRSAIRRQSDIAIREPNFTILDTDRKSAGFTDKAIDEGRIRVS